MPPLPVYCSHEDAFRLSDCPDPWVFVQKMHRLLLEGMPSTARRNVRGSERESVPQTIWIDCRPILLGGEVLSKKFFRYHMHPNGRRTLERREFRGYGEGGIALVGPTWSDEPQILFVDLQFLTTDFLKAWKKLSSGKVPTRTKLTERNVAAARALIQAKKDKRGGKAVGLRLGVEIIQAKFPSVSRTAARDIVRSVDGNTQPGRPKN
jgi:hypothetical protein